MVKYTILTLLALLFVSTSAEKSFLESESPSSLTYEEYVQAIARRQVKLMYRPTDAIFTLDPIDPVQPIQPFPGQPEPRPSEDPQNEPEPYEPDPIKREIGIAWWLLLIIIIAVITVGFCLSLCICHKQWKKICKKLRKGGKKISKNYHKNQGVF